MLLVFIVGELFAVTPKVKFNENGELKIVQITDTHYKTKKKASRKATECIASVLDAEKPDMVMITGDLLYSSGGREAIDSVMAPIVARGIPFGFVFGNHDTQFELSHAEFYDYISSLPGSLMPQRGNIDSPDYVIKIFSTGNDETPAAALYCLDSHATAKVKECGKYAWLELNQIEWYKTVSDSLGRIPGLMFFHIPLPEMSYADTNDKISVVGTMREKICCPELNSGMFSAIKEQGDVRGIFFGHDHDNDFAAAYYGVLLAYGRYSGGKTVYNHLGTPGARVIVIHRDDPAISTWIRLMDGKVINAVDFHPDKKELTPVTQAHTK